MKRFLAITMALFLIVACFAGCAAKENENTAKAKFIMGIDPEYPPFSSLGDDGKYTGFDVEVCQAVCDKLGWEFEVFAVNWDQKLVQLDAKECDCVWSGMTILDTMKDGYTISAPYFDNKQVIITKETSGINSSKDLAGKTVAVQLGTSGEAALNEDLKDLKDTFKQLVPCDSFITCFSELAGNSVDAVFVDKPVAASYAAKNKGFKIIDEDMGIEQYGIAFRKGDERCKQVEDAITELVADGTYKKIADKYTDINQGNLIYLNK